MKRLYAALRFREDENISDRTYWYFCDLSVQEGQAVLAPVGTRSCLQRAVIERLVLAEDEDAPYDPRLIKRVEAIAGARRLDADGQSFLELGGVRYDRKRYTRFRRILVSCSPHPPQGEAEEALRLYGVRRTILARRFEEGLLEACGARACALLYGDGARALGETILHLARGEERDGGSPALHTAAAWLTGGET